MHPKAGTALAGRLASAQTYDTFTVSVFLKEEPARDMVLEAADALSSDGRASAVDTIKRRCAANQESLLAALQQLSEQTEAIDAEVSVPKVSFVRPYWINNAVVAEVSLSLLEDILQRPDVLHVELVRHAPLKELLDGSIRGLRLRRRGTIEASSAVAAAADDTPIAWSVKHVGAPHLWAKEITGKGVVVAVVDTGVNYLHPDLKDHMWDGGLQYPKHGYDFASDDNDPIDSDGHGTSCAGLAAGNGTAGLVTGVAPESLIMAIRVGGSEELFWKGFQFAIENGAHVISMSQSWKYPSHPDYPGWRRTCETILAAGLLHSNSIGNQGTLLSGFPIPYNIATPGNCPPPRIHPLQSVVGGIASPVSCGATDNSDALADYSGRGPAAWEIAQYTDYPYAQGTKPGLIKPDVCAPGPGTTSCNYAYPQQVGAKPYTDFGGTSAATPHVGGCLALLAHACLRSNNPIMPARVLEALENSAVRIQGQSRDKENHFGAGRVDVFAAYRYGETKGWWK